MPDRCIIHAIIFRNSEHSFPNGYSVGGHGKRFDPIIDVVWHFQLQIFDEHSTVLDLAEGLSISISRKVQCVYDNKVVGLKEGGDGVEEMNKSY